MTDWKPPDQWVLADALDQVAHRHGWRPIQRTTSTEEVTVIYRRDPLLALLDSIPEETTP